MGTGYSPSSHPPSYPPSSIPRVHPSPYPYRCTDVGVRTEQCKVAVGLISVAQLTLSLLFSHIRGMTEVYNLLRIDNR